MYQTYFGLRDHPFSITPDPSYLYLSPPHQEALAHLLYGTHEDGGFVQLTGEVGTGKTTLIRSLLVQHLDNIDVALCLNPKLTVHEFVASICDELKITYPRDSASLKPLIDALNTHLLASHGQGRQTVLIIDEAQNLSRDVLEQIRLLTNLETHRHKLLRIILVGQPELQQLLERADLRQLAQRITARYHLPSLNRQETIAYIDHRLSVAGSSAKRLFSGPALQLIYRRSGGIPRLINVICDRALLGAYVRGKQWVDRSILSQAAREVLPEKVSSRQTTTATPWLTLASALAVALAVGLGIRPASLELEQASVASPNPSATTTMPLLEINEATSEVPVTTPANEADIDDEAEITDTALAALPSTSEPVTEPLATPQPVVESTPINLAALLTSFSGPSDAMTRLLRLWGEDDITVTAGVYPCETLKNRNLSCLSGQTDWATLRRYNRPAVIHLIDMNGEIRQVLLRSLSDDQAVLEFGQEPFTTSIGQLDTLWTGEYLLLWRPPVAQSLIGPGSQGDEVIWLRRQLTFAENGVLPSGSLSDQFDAKLDQMVRRFQRTHNLEVDGLVGTQTLLLINNIAPPPGTPLLNTPLLGKV